MKVNIASNVGNATPMEFEVGEKDKVDDLVVMVAEAQAVDPERINLLMDGELLERSQTLKKAGIRDGTHLKVGPRSTVGGADLNPRTAARIRTEIARAQASCYPLYPLSPLKWRARLPGAGTWKGQHFNLEMRLPPTFPAKPPLVLFLNQPKPPHPNIAASGAVCCNNLMGDWNPGTHNLVTVYEDMRALLRKPNYHHPLNREALRAMPVRIGRPGGEFHRRFLNMLRGL